MVDKPSSAFHGTVERNLYRGIVDWEDKVEIYYNSIQLKFPI